jgi:predicted glutamine amidotransferase
MKAVADMCRWIAYRGAARFLSSLVTEPEHSLIDQSLNAAEAKTVTNGDGFGLGWYGERPEPGLYHEILPAWSDQNLKHLVHQIRSPLFFAHIRASTGTATARANCHPFAWGRWLFMHNGQIGGYGRVRRRLESLLPDEIFPFRRGATDSELMFLIAVSMGLEEDPIGAIQRMLEAVLTAMREAKITEALRFTSTLTDGEQMIAFRYASDDRAPTLYYCTCDDGTMVVSEPLDRCGRWQCVPPNHLLICRGDNIRDVQPFAVTARVAEAA